MLTKFARSVTPRKAGVIVLLTAAIAAVAATLSTGGSQTAAPTHSLSAPAGTHSASGGKSSTSSQAVGSGPIVSQALHHDTSAPLRTITPTKFPNRGPQLTPDADGKRTPKPAGNQGDPVVQNQFGAGQIPALSVNFEGVGVGQGGQWAPPDPNGAVGPNNYFEIVNDGFAIYTKSGAVALSARPTNTIFSGFGGNCQASNDGDGTVLFDHFAQRWIVQQFNVSGSPYSDCIAVSTTSDPTGSWNRYEFATNNVDFNDYPKLGVWADGYYISYNIFTDPSQAYTGPEVCAFDKSKMVQGLAATQQCFKRSASYYSLLPADIDGVTPPPAGSPELFLGEDTNSLELWKFHVDWTTPANSTFSSSPTQFSVPVFTEACGGGTCIPQPGTTQKLDSLGDRLMYRLAYRNFGDHEALVVAQSVNAGGVTGMRWYELRGPWATPTVFQSGTYQPDTNYRWMGSIAQDDSGDMALGFAVSSSSVSPGARYTGRLVGDASGSMGQGEGTLVTGTGSQNGGLTRWGDYTSMSVDPVDDCTFWYLGEYLASNGSWNWHTRIGAFKYPSCTGGGGNAPIVSSFLPTSGPVGTNVAITGTGFTGANAVKFNGTSATTYNVDSDTSIHATVPLGATTGPISVTTGNGTGASATNYTVTTGGGNPPTVTSFNPTSGPVGTNVQISGTNFTGATGVTFNNTPATTFTIDSDTSIHATVPVGATTGAIAVTNGSGTGTSSTNFTVTTSGVAPVITSFSPTQGPVGTKVRVNGSNFTGVTAVAFNGTPSGNFTFVSDAQLTVYVPAGATTGPISVTTGNGSGQSVTNYTVTIPPPQVTGFTPTSGRHGQSISILGKNFTGATTVRLGTTATTFTIVSDTKITAVVPTLRVGQYKWSVTNGAGAGTSTSYFRVLG